MSRPAPIGILTGGGDVPGLNSVIKSVVYRSTELGYEVIGLRRGWEALTHMRPGPEPDPDYVRPLDRIEHPDDRPDRRHIPPLQPHEPAEDAGRQAARPSCPAERLPALETRRGRLRLHAGRPREPRPARDPHPHLDRRRRHALVLEGPRRRRRPDHRHPQDDGQRRPGGPSTASASRPRSRGRRTPSTASGRRSGSHERIGVFRVFGRNAGFTALYTAYVTSARCVIPEYRFDLQQLVDVLVEDRLQQPQPLLVRHRLGGRPPGGDGAPGGRRGRRLRSPPQGEHRRVPGRGDQAPDRHRDRELGADLRPSLRRARRPRPDGRRSRSPTSRWSSSSRAGPAR